MKSKFNQTKRELLALPNRKWDDTRPVYDSLLVFSTGKKHSSGWAMVAIVGVRELVPIEICTACSDDIEFVKSPGCELRADCVLASGAIHFWGNGCRFKVGDALSSTYVTLIKQK